jgi:hypothetical protein
MLIAHGADLDAALDTKDTPLHLAVKGKHIETLEELLSRSAAVHASGSADRSPLHMAAATGHMPTIECLLQHSWLDTSAAAGDMARSAVAAAQATILDASTKQSVVLRLLLPAVRSNTAAAKATLQQCMEPAGSTVPSVLIDAWLESATVVADITRQRIAVQHLIVSMAAVHKQQLGELEKAQQDLLKEKQHTVDQMLATDKAVLNQQRESLVVDQAKVAEQQQQLSKQLTSLKMQEQLQASAGQAQAVQQRQLNNDQAELWKLRQELTSVLQHLTAKENLAAEVQAFKQEQHLQQVPQLQKQLAEEQSKAKVAAEVRALQDKLCEQQLNQLPQLRKQLAEEQSKAQAAVAALAVKEDICQQLAHALREQLANENRKAKAVAEDKALQELEEEQLEQVAEQEQLAGRLLKEHCKAQAVAAGYALQENEDEQPRQQQPSLAVQEQVAEKVLEHMHMREPSCASTGAGSSVFLCLLVVACVPHTVVTAGLIAPVFLPMGVVGPVVLAVAGLLLSLAVVNMP